MSYRARCIALVAVLSVTIVSCSFRTDELVLVSAEKVHGVPQVTEKLTVTPLEAVTKLVGREYSPTSSSGGNAAKTFDRCLIDHTVQNLNLYFTSGRAAEGEWVDIELAVTNNGTSTVDFDPADFTFTHEDPSKIGKRNQPIGLSDFGVQQSGEIEVIMTDMKPGLFVRAQDKIVGDTEKARIIHGQSHHAFHVEPGKEASFGGAFTSLAPGYMTFKLKDHATNESTQYIVHVDKR